MSKLQIEEWPLGKLRTYNRNPRTHSAEQIEAIAASIREFGFLCPIVVDKGAEIIAGEGRFLAAGKLGLKKVPVIAVDHLTESQKKAFILADNKLAERAGWDEALLGEVLRDLQLEGFDLLLTGFDTAELERELEKAAAEHAADFLDDMAQAGEAGQAAGQGLNLNFDAGQGDPGEGAQPQELYFQLSYTVTEEQRAVVLKALNAVKEAQEFQTSAEALVWLCRKHLEEVGQ